MANGNKVNINVKSDVLLDERLDISVTGLVANSKVTLRMYLKKTKADFSSHGHYTADNAGRIRLTEEPSVGGTYYGLEPMGLFWSLQPSPGSKLGTYYTYGDVTKSDTLILTVHQGFLDHEELAESKPMAEAIVKRRFMADNVERIPIQHGRLRGTVYKPKGEGPFPGVLHLYGLTTVPWDHMASCLASYGFAVFHVLYMWHDDLPKSVEDVGLEYFMEAVDWFSCESYITKGGIQAIGICYAGVIVMLLASLKPDKIRSVVVVNSFTFTFKPAFKYQGETLPHNRGNLRNIIKRKDGTWSLKECYKMEDVSEEHWIKVENIRKILFIVGDDDHGFNGLESAECSISRLKSKGVDNYEIVTYPGAGHLIEVPYMPVTTMTCWGETSNLKEFAGAIMYWGGKSHSHARAQEESWQKIRDYLQKNASDGLSNGMTNVSKK